MIHKFPEISVHFEQKFFLTSKFEVSNQIKKVSLVVVAILALFSLYWIYKIVYANKNSIKSLDLNQKDQSLKKNWGDQKIRHKVFQNVDSVEEDKRIDERVEEDIDSIEEEDKGVEEGAEELSIENSELQNEDSLDEAEDSCIESPFKAIEGEFDSWLKQSAKKFPHHYTEDRCKLVLKSLCSARTKKQFFSGIENLKDHEKISGQVAYHVKCEFETISPQLPHKHKSKISLVEVL